jgi:hypothetical protein
VRVLINLSLFKPNIIKMNVHSVTQSNAAYLRGTAYLNRVQCSSLGCSGAQEGAA